MSQKTNKPYEIDESQMLGKEDLNQYLNELSKELKKEFGRNARFEVILVGGGSVLLNYDFRNMTTDLDYFVASGHSIKAAINRVTDKNDLSVSWMNTDFRKTESYTPELTKASKYYKTFNQVLTVRTIDGADLIAMKLKSFRQYKHDLSDIVGIYEGEKSKGNELTYDNIKQAYSRLYGELDLESNVFLKKLTHGILDYQAVVAEEERNKESIQEFDKKYPNVLKQDNINSILEQIKLKETGIPGNYTEEEHYIANLINTAVTNQSVADKHTDQECGEYEQEKDQFQQSNYDNEDWEL